MSICEACNSEHDGDYGSGRFCDAKCARGFSTKAKRKEISEKVSKKNKGKIPWNKDKQFNSKIKINCEKCKRAFNPRRKAQRFCSKTCSSKHNMEKINKNITSEERSEISRRSYKEGKNYVAGGHTKWIPYKDIKVQGSYELRMCKLLDDMKDSNLIFDWEYTKDKIRYVNIDGKESTYFLDFKVYDNDDSFYYIETKGYKKENDDLKWEAVRKQGLELKVMFNDDIKNLERSIGEMVSRLVVSQ